MSPRQRSCGIAASLVALATLSACLDDADGPSLGAANEGLGEGIWVVADMGDFNGDGMSDLLWNDPGKNMMAVWLMAGTEVLFAGKSTLGPPGVAWNAAWAADFNADGLADVRFFNSGDESTAVWLMNGTDLFLPGKTIAGPLGGNWTRVASADFSADGMADLLWRNKVTDVAEVWLMHGTQVFLRGPELPPPLGAGWSAVTTGDFNADGMVDVLWHNPTTSCYSVLLMSATEPFLRGPARPGPLGADWAPVTGQDFNADGMADILWYNSTRHTIAIWLMAGTDVLVPGPEIPAPPGDGWLPTTAGDVNADGMADVMWQNPAGRRFALWLMAGTQVLLPGPEIPGPALL